ncbi:hypothetical protein, partial [Escherichia coli]|uniref:hypothetical protein n=1 Tax=Escherichia coli TaxID=562 RepID=UPI00372D2794
FSLHAYVLAREIISSSEAVTMMSTAKTYLITLHPDHTNCLYALVRIRYQDLCPGLRFMSDRASTVQRNIFFITLLTFTGTR